MELFFLVAVLFMMSVSGLHATIRNQQIKLLIDPHTKIADSKGTQLLDLSPIQEALEGKDLPTNDEIIDWIADDGVTTICRVPRKVAIQYTLLHKGIGVLLLNKEGNEIFVHQRSSTKRVFPSMYDMLIGGVCNSGEDSLVAMKRELKEEVSITVTDDTACRYLGTMRCQTSYNFCQVACYSINCSSAEQQNIKFADGEIQWGAFVSMVDLQERMLAKESPLEFVPDGLQVWKWMLDEKHVDEVC